MTNFKIISIFIYCIAVPKSFSQNGTDSISLNFELKFGREVLQLNKSYLSSKRDTIELKTFKFYISDIKFDYSDKTADAKPNDYFLIDIENPKSLHIPICKKNNKVISSLSFSIGVDSTASVSGALSGDLDPAKGMYWAWQSGYINMKIEGKSSSCKTRKNEFRFHIGGYLKPNYAIRKIELHPNQTDSNITVDVSKLFDTIDLSRENSVMVPGETAMKFANSSVKIFSIE
jgi:hypothetical protein